MGIFWPAANVAMDLSTSSNLLEIMVPRFWVEGQGCIIWPQQTQLDLEYFWGWEKIEGGSALFPLPVGTKKHWPVNLIPGLSEGGGLRVT